MVEEMAGKNEGKAQKSAVIQIRNINLEFDVTAIFLYILQHLLRWTINLTTF